MSADKCGTCLERRKPYPKNIPRETESDCSTTSSSGGGGGAWSFFSSQPKEDNGCGCPPPKPAGDACCPKANPDSCESKKCSSSAPACPANSSTSCGSTESSCKSECAATPPPCKKPLGTGALPGTPIPNMTPALMLPPWLKCPPCITVPPFKAPCGAVIRPISESKRGNDCPSGGKCDRCGQHKPPPSPAKCSPNCPMMKNIRKCGAAKAEAAAGAAAATATEVKKEGLMNKVMSMFSFDKKAEKPKPPEPEKK